MQKRTKTDTETEDFLKELMNQIKSLPEATKKEQRQLCKIFLSFLRMIFDMLKRFNIFFIKTNENKNTGRFD